MARIDTSIAQGDPALRPALWKTLHPDVRQVCAKVLGPGPDADDVADSVLVDFLYRYAERLESTAAARSYVRLMAMRRAVRYARRRDRLEPVEEERVATEPPAVSAEERADVQRMLPRLERCLEELKPKARVVLQLKFEGELTNERIGGQVGGSKQYIGRLITKSLGLLKKCLEKAGRSGRVKGVT